MSAFVEDESGAMETFDLYQIHKQCYDEVLEKWSVIYGSSSTSFNDTKKKIENAVEEFWEHQKEAAEERQRSLVDAIEKMGKEAVELEKILEMDRNMMNLSSNIPLVEMEGNLWELLKEYRAKKDERMAHYNNLIEQEKNLCNILDEVPQIPPLPTTNAPEECSNIPHKKDIQRYEELIQQLRAQAEELKFEYEEQQFMLQSLLNECGVNPMTKVERAAASIDGTELPASARNLELLKKSVEFYSNVKHNMIEEANSLREDIVKLSRKMMKDPNTYNEFLNKYAGHTKNTISKLKEMLDSLNEERRGNLKDLIIQHRALLDDLWTRCCYSDDQRAQFRPYYVDYYSEDILGHHELEAENLETFYNQNRKIFNLVEKHKELWARLLQLEELAADTQRLFTNRGGKLLLEEKERKTIQKKLPAIKAELVTLLNEYKARTGKDLLYFGTSMLDMLENLEEERENKKENKRKVRKAVNTETVLLESRLGSRPAANKRKIVTPQINMTTTKVMKMTQSSANSTKVMKMTQSSANSTSSSASYKSASSNRGQKVLPSHIPTCGNNLAVPTSGLPRVGVGAAAGTYAMLHTPSRNMTSRTPAASTPENGSPSYESFQEHLEKSLSKKICHSSRMNPERVLRSRNLNQTVTKPSRVTPYKTPKTPSKTPTRIPFRIATGGKIPSIVPPISPRSATKFTTPRNKLPIIF